MPGLYNRNKGRRAACNPGRPRHDALQLLVVGYTRAGPEAERTLKLHAPMQARLSAGPLARPWKCQLAPVEGRIHGCTRQGSLIFCKAEANSG
jgi:hypothetical protein